MHFQRNDNRHKTIHSNPRLCEETLKEMPSIITLIIQGINPGQLPNGSSQDLFTSTCSAVTIYSKEIKSSEPAMLTIK